MRIAYLTAHIVASHSAEKKEWKIEDFRPIRRFRRYEKSKPQDWRQIKNTLGAIAVPSKRRT